MRRDNRFRIGVVVVLVLLAIWSLLPTVRVGTMDEAEQQRMAVEDPEAWKDLQEKAIKLGLDLRGGMHLVLDIDLESLEPDQRGEAQDRFVQIIRNRVDQYGVSEPVIQKQGEDRVVVELAGVDDPEQARDLVGRTAQLSYKMLESAEVLTDLVDRMNRTLYEGLVRAEIDRRSIGLHLVQEEQAGLEGVAGLDTSAADSLRVPEEPLNLYLYSNPATPEVLFAQENMMSWVDSILVQPSIRRLIPRDAEFHWAMWPDPRYAEEGVEFRELYLTEASPVVTGEHLESATVTIGGPGDMEAAGQPVVNFRMTAEGGRTIARVTKANIGRRMAIILDGRVAVAPTIQGALGRDSRITGIGDMGEARNISIVLESGALPTDAQIVENRTVGPSLGEDSIRAGTTAALIGLLAVIVFMVVYYRGSGLIADLALFLNMLFILAVLAGFGFTLTLPGIAGIILTIGMAVDANVLIYDRIKEELRAGKTVRAAVVAGYANATSAILDANVTTLITALVLYQFGTGPIRGFALTLSVGIISSVFTALIVTRLVFDALLDRPGVEKISI
ncbi:MAG: protein translocase subunit SecD [bacterium]